MRLYLVLLRSFAWLFCNDDCPCEVEVYNPLLLSYDDEDVLSGATSSEMRELYEEANSRANEYSQREEELSRLVRRRGLPEAEKEAQLDTFARDLVARPWQSKRGQEIAAAIEDYHDSRKLPLLLEHKQTVPLIRATSEVMEKEG